MRSVKATGLVMAVMLFTTAAVAQSADDVLRYSLQYPSYDATSLVMPGVAFPTGFGAYQENPASMALFDQSFLSFGLSNRAVGEESRYLGNRTDFKGNELNVGDFGFVYHFPTEQGRMVVGAGYSQTADFNRGYAAGGFNGNSTITDFYNRTPDDSLFFAAFDVYAIDFATTDSSFNDTESIFRIGVDYMGINQDVEMEERGRMGEYSAFFATEFARNFMVGASVGLTEGNYSYVRDFLESDRQNNYDFAFIPTESGDTDIDRILSRDSITGNFTGFSARLGAIYRFTRQVQLGLSYQFPTRLSMEERFNTRITTTFDNGIVYEADAPGRFSYKIVRPMRANAGFTVQDVNNLNFSASVEYVPYTEGEIDFGSLELRELQESINSTVQSELEDVFNIRAGIGYEVNDRFTPRVGYALFPSPRSGFDATRHFYSAGFSAEISPFMTLDLGIQYGTWNDETALYEYGNGLSETVSGKVGRWHTMAGLKIEL